MPSAELTQFRTEFGSRLRECRTAAHLSQGDVAKHLNVSKSFVTSIEKGRTALQLQHVRRLATILQADLEDLIP